MRLKSFIVINLLALVLYFLPIVSSQVNYESDLDKEKKAETVIPVRAKERGFPHISFEDGKDLLANNNANQNASSPKFLTSADFDSDGTIDLITADSAGNIDFYRGNPDSIYPNSSEAQTRKAAGNFNENAFAESVQSFNLPISPDYIETGDFNADGHQDILAARNGDNVLYLIAGNGSGNFAADVKIAVEGLITAFTVGEIGRRDGQTDVAIAVINKKVASLLVFEHPEGAFKYKPERIKLLSASNDLAIGNLDADFFADVAVASGNKLTLIHGRGQAYPWDLLKESDIERPSVVLETRVLPFEIAAIETGYFTEKRGMSLAILLTNGSLQTLDSPKAESKPLNLDPKYIKRVRSSVPATKSEKIFSSFTYLNEDNPDATEDLLPADNDEREKILQDRQQKAAEAMQKLSPEEKSKHTAESLKRVEESRQRAKANFLKAISPRDSAPLNNWNLQNIISDARLASSAVSSNNAKLTRIQVSGSSTEDLAFIDTNAKKIHILARGQATETQTTTDEIVSLDVETSPLAILPMRLNSDALSDLVVLRQGSATPSIVMTSPTQTFVVNSTADNDICDNTTCTLRGAIRRANITNGFDTITFNIGGGGLRTITPNSNLPEIEFSMSIDATTQPGYMGFPLIEIKGTNIDDGGDGFQINTSFVTIRGFAINEFHSFYLENEDRDLGGNGITIFNFANSNLARFNIISSNHLGTDSGGTVDKGNDISGLNIFDSDNNIVVSNVMSGNGTNNDPAIERKIGSGLSMIAANNTEVYANRIGTNGFGNAKLNNSVGIFMSGNNNSIGKPNQSSGSNQGNLVSGNGDREALLGNPVNGCLGKGISEDSVINDTTGEFITRFNNFQGNKIGTNSAGTAAIGNCSVGLATSPRHESIVGSITESGRNIISGNHNNGIICSTRGDSFGGFAENLGGLELPVGKCTIVGNNVGTNTAGTAAIPNDRVNGQQFIVFEGVVIVYNTDTFSVVGSPGGNTPTACTGFCNLISGNTGGRGVTRVSEFGSVGIFNNYIGTRRSGDAALPNDTGVLVFSGGDTFIGSVGVENSNQVSLGNLISGNRSSAMFAETFDLDLYSIIVRNNLIGTDKTGLTAIPNNTNDTTSPAVGLISGIVDLGGVNPQDGNVISGNSGDGVQFFRGIAAGLAFNNLIGVNKNGQPLGNASDGIRIISENIRVFGNTIANNGRSGVYVFSNSTNIVVKRNPIRFNSIYNNGGLGIDLDADITIPIEPDGVTPNDCLDVDELANGLQNFPLLTAPVFNANGSVSLDGGLQSKPVTRFVIDYYSNATADPTTYGEGETYIGSQIVESDSDGQVGFEFTSSVPVAPNVKITATATDVDGNTSEFSCFAGECTGGTGGLTKAEILKLLAPTCLTPIVVNINTDEPDTSPGNGICDVDTSTVGSQCSLRAAIQTTNATTGFDLVNFDIPGGGIQTIAPTSALPPITQQVFIDATTQPGYVSSPMVEVRGDAAPPETNGLTFAGGSSNSALIGLTINRFTTGIALQSSSNRIEKSYVGLLADGVTVDTALRQKIGIKITGNRNKIGGNRNGALPNNIITGNNFRQISVGTSQAFQNVIVGNNIGLNVNGTIAAPDLRTIHGIVFDNGASRNKIGGVLQEDSNLIDGFLSYGILIADNSNENTVMRNSVSRCNVGIGIVQASNNTIGGSVGSFEAESSRNIIGGNPIGIFVGDNPNPDGIVEPDGNNLMWHKSTDSKKRRTKLGLVQTSNNKIYGNLIGITANSANFSNEFGINIRAAKDTQVGTGSFGFHNFISNNGEIGVLIEKEAIQNKIQGNFIGTDITGNTAKPNIDGITLSGSDNQILKNVISGNIGYGVHITRDSNNDPLPQRNTIADNKIGTTSNDTSALPNTLDGIVISNGGQNNLIGGANAGNVIAGNGRDGINIEVGDQIDAVAPSQNTIQGNLIGVSKEGVSIPNGRYGISVRNSPDNIIGGNNTGEGNTIANNIADGIRISETSSNFANKASVGGLGTSLVTKNAIFSNGGDGLRLESSSGSFSAQAFVSENEIYNNMGNGILTTVAHETTHIFQQNTVRNNGGSGISTAESDNNEILVNRVENNAGQGIVLKGGQTSQNKVRSNIIKNNGSHGVDVINGANNNRIGGTAVGQGNTINNNGGSGINVGPTAGQGNNFDPNIIFGNTLLGIDLNGDGIVSPNDPADADIGPNNLQNHPDIVSKQIVNDELILGFRVDSAPANSAYGTSGIYVEFFKADASGEGERFLGSGYYTLGDYNGSLSTRTINLGNINTLGITPSDPITATATDDAGNTSEFTPFAPTAADASISGRVFGGNGRGLAKARLVLTDTNGNSRYTTTNPFGYYRFAEVESGQVYIVNVVSKKYQFSPQVLTVNESLEGINFFPNPQK